LFFVVNREIHVFRAGSLDDASKYRLTRAIIDARNWGTNFAEWDWAEWYVVDLDHDGWGTEIRYIDDPEHDGFVFSISAGADCVFGTADDYCVRVCTIGVRLMPVTTFSGLGYKQKQVVKVVTSILNIVGVTLDSKLRLGLENSLFLLQSHKLNWLNKLLINPNLIEEPTFRVLISKRATGCPSKLAPCIDFDSVKSVSGAFYRLFKVKPLNSVCLELWFNEVDWILSSLYAKDLGVLESILDDICLNRG